MPDKRTRIDDHHSQQDLKVLGLQDDEYHGEQVHPHQQLVDHLRADLVHMTVAEVVNHSDECYQADKGEGDVMVIVESLILEQGLEVGNARDMLNERVKMSCEKAQRRQKPIRGNQSNDRCAEHTEAESHHLKPDEQPE